MTEYVTLPRDDAYFLIHQTAQAPLAVEGETARLGSITRDIAAQPRREGRPVGDPQAFAFYVVRIEYSDRSPIAVRSRFEDARTIADAFNLASGEQAAIFGYDANGIGEGERIYPN